MFLFLLNVRRKLYQLPLILGDFQFSLLDRPLSLRFSVIDSLELSFEILDFFYDLPYFHLTLAISAF